MSIRFLLTCVISGLLCVTMGVAGWIGTVRVSSALTAKIQESLELSAKANLARLLDRIDDAEIDLRTLVVMPVMGLVVDGDPDGEIASFLDAIMLRHPEILHLHCFDAAGRMVVAEGAVFRHGHPAEAWMNTGNLWRGATVVLPPTNDELIIAVPIPAPYAASETIGVLEAHLDWQHLSTFINVPDETQVVLQDAAGKVLSEGGARLFGRAPEGLFTVEAHADTDAPPVARGWRLSMSQDRDYALREVRSLQEGLFALFVAMVVIGIGASFLVAQRLARPLRDLSGAAGRLP